MSAEAALVARVGAVAAITALIGTAPVRFYANVLPQGCTLPAIAYQRMPGQRIRAMHADTGIVRARFWLNIYSTTHDGARAVADAVIAGLNRWYGTSASVVVCEMRTDDGQDAYEADLLQHRVVIDLEMDYQEAVVTW